MTTERFEREPTVLWRSTSAGAALLPAAPAEVVHLRGAALVVWELLDVPRSAEELSRSAEALGLALPGFEDSIAPLLEQQLIRRA